jgi:hypothetical protein
MNSSFNAQSASSATATTGVNRNKSNQSNRKNSEATLGFKNILILFFSAMAVSLVVLVLFFGLFFQKVDFSLNTKPLESVSTPIESTQTTTENAVPPAEDLAQTFDEIQLNVPTDARNMAANNSANPSITTPNTEMTNSGAGGGKAVNGQRKQRNHQEPFMGVGEANTTGSDDFELPPSNTQESASDVMIESAPPLPAPPTPNIRGKKQKTAPVTENNNKGSNTESELMPMAPVPNGN